MIDTAKNFIELVDSGTIDSLAKSQNEVISDEICYDIIDNYPDYVENLALNINLSLPILKKLSQSKSWRVRCWVAIRNELDYELFDKLSRDKREPVRRTIAYNSKTPLKILQAMYPDKVDDINEKLMERISSASDSTN